MKNSYLLGIMSAYLLLFIQTSQAATIVLGTSVHTAQEIHNLDVGGTFYNVKFTRGTYTEFSPMLITGGGAAIAAVFNDYNATATDNITHAGYTNATGSGGGAAVSFQVPQEICTSQPCSTELWADWVLQQPSLSGNWESFTRNTLSLDDNRVFADFSVVPIPAAAWLFGSALLGLGVVKRRKA